MHVFAAFKWMQNKFERSLEFNKTQASTYVYIIFLNAPLTSPSDEEEIEAMTMIYRLTTSQCIFFGGFGKYIFMVCSEKKNAPLPQLLCLVSFDDFDNHSFYRWCNIWRLSVWRNYYYYLVVYSMLLTTLATRDFHLLQRSKCKVGTIGRLFDHMRSRKTVHKLKINML